MTVYEMINKIILEKLDEGVIPWQKMWKSESGLPAISLSTGKVYNGINQILLSCLATNNGASPYFLTYKQALTRGGHIISGESGYPIFFFKKIEQKDDEKEETEKSDDTEASPRFILRYYTVFNLEQCNDVKLSEKEEKLLKSMERELNAFPPDLRAEGILKSYYEMPKINISSVNNPSYSSGKDLIRMPRIGQFETVEEYYVSFFHEMIHSTGHDSRMNRLVKNRTDKQRAVEELIAEIGSVYLSYEAGMENQIIDNSTAYINYWKNKIKENSRLFTTATSKAEKACQFILDHSLQEAYIVLSA
jgi:antirestriction protein ArdC